MSISSAPRRCAARRPNGRSLDNLRQPVDAFDVILISDQAETSRGGVVTPAVRDAAGGAGRAASRAKCSWPIPARGSEQFRTSWSSRTGRRPKRPAASCSAPWTYGQLLRRVECAQLLFVTQGEKGVRCGDRDWRAVGARRARVEQARGYLRSGRQLLGGRGAGAGRDRIASGSRAIRQSGGIHHDHEKGHRNGVARRIAGGA